MASKLGVDLKVTRLLLEIGVMAVWMGRSTDGEAIVRHVKAFRDDVPHPGSALAGAFLFQGRHQDAIAETRSLLTRFPNHQMAKSLLGIAMFESGHRDWEKPLREVIADGRDQWAITLAQDTLGYDYKPAAPRGPAAGPPRAGAALA